ncbi:RidA family protein [Pseudomonas marginalis]|uniref:hypothetical protein n=1 Tax=Pseudomonas marginalis TaxID=298 RepID=UPI002A35FB41|nr:hypothetical protein [Pseudomonas marginalis]WPN23382.1 hypothetical protein QMK57_29050 [Pseudomonas marginalis]
MTITRISSNERLSGAVTFKDLVFLSGMAPTCTTLQAELARPSVLVEISVIAVRK